MKRIDRRRVGYRISDVVESWRGRGIRMASAMVALGLAVLAFVATSALTQTVRFQVSDQFDSLEATQVVANYSPVSESNRADMEDTDLEGLRQTPGVIALGTYAQTESGYNLSPSGLTDSSAPLLGRRVVAVDPSLPTAAECGTPFVPDDGVRVVWLGANLAGQYGLGPANIGEPVRMNGVDYAFAGVFPPCPRLPIVDTSLVVPLETGRTMLKNIDSGHVLVRTEPGAALGIAAAMPVYFDAQGEGQSWQVLPPPDPRTMRQQVDTQLAAAGLLAAVVLALTGGVAVASAMATMVRDRSAEFGLRRAHGAPRSQIGALVLADATLVGGLSAIIGSMLGVAVVLGVSAYQGWAPVVDPMTLIAALAATPVIAAISGIAPGWRAARQDPVEALKS